MSNHISLGPWELRFLLVDKDNGEVSYLTGNGIDKVVTIEPVYQPSRQRWFARPVEGKENWYTITQDLKIQPLYGLAQLHDSYKVILSTKPGEFRLQEVPDIISPNGPVYKIHHPPPIHVEHFLLGKEGHEAVIQQFPIQTGKPEPAWHFVPASGEE